MLRTMRDIRPSLRLPLLLMLLCLALPMRGQDSITFKIQDPGKGFVEVGGNWRFHTGDDLAWAKPEHDDSSWEQLRGDKTWGAQTHPSYVGFAWYRKPIEVDGASGQLTILMPPVDDAYELYWNGKKIGGSGSLPPNAHWDAVPRATTFPLPTNSGLLAVRVWKSILASVDTTTLGGMEAAPRIGDSAYLSLQTRATYMERERRRLPVLISSSLMLVTGLISLLVFMRERRRWLYFWLALYLIAIGAQGNPQHPQYRRRFFRKPGVHPTFLLRGRPFSSGIAARALRSRPRTLVETVDPGIGGALLCRPDSGPLHPPLLAIRGQGPGLDGRHHHRDLYHCPALHCRHPDRWPAATQADRPLAAGSYHLVSRASGSLCAG